MCSSLNGQESQSPHPGRKERGKSGAPGSQVLAAFRCKEPVGPARKSKSESKAADRSVRSTRSAQKEKAVEISLNGLYFMPATTYSPTHFRVQYNRPCGA